jgi:uncharacterized protein YdaT
MRTMRIEEVQAELKAIHEGEEPILVVHEGYAIGFVIPVASAKGQELLEARQDELYEDFSAEGSSASRTFQLNTTNTSTSSPTERLAVRR